MPYVVIIENKAQKEFLKIPVIYHNSVKKNIGDLADNPRPHGVKKLVGSKDAYRVRVGDYRILFIIDDKRKIVTIYRIRNRKEAY
jgi:mRNA interferase RelE/StbE